MKLLTFLSLQAVFIALLCSSVFTQKRIATLDGLIKVLGALYQRKLFSLRDDAEHLRDQYPNGGPIKPELRETVTFPRQHMCMKSIPYCVSFYATMIIQDAPDEQVESKRKNIRNGIDRPCFSDIVLGSCPQHIGMDNPKEIMDVSKLKINDFCVPGTVELNGTLDILNEITPDSTVYVELNRLTRPSPKRRSDLSSRCLNGGAYCRFYSTCDLIERDGCKGRRNFYNDPQFPCSCPIGTGTYDMSGVKKEVTKIEEFAIGRKDGFVVVATETAKTCFSFSFTGSVGRS